MILRFDHHFNQLLFFFYPACLLKIEEEQLPLQDESIKKRTIRIWCCWCQNEALSPSLGLFKLLYLYHVIG